MPSDERLEIRRRRILEMIGVWAGKLERILSGQNVELGAIPLPQEMLPGEDPVSRVRRVIAFYQAVLSRFSNGSYGTCEACGGPIPGAELDEMPWATVCRGCAAGASGLDRA